MEPQRHLRLPVLGGLVPKYRRAVLVSGADRRLKAIFRKVCAEWKVRLIKREVIPDPVHVHVRVAVDPQYVRS
ncbi:MAG: hypothetical protein EBQ58_05405 [Betaproteobacteria bacterium]|nr:hypothetical protein [Betaproteobacteria bacterium]